MTTAVVEVSGTGWAKLLAAALGATMARKIEMRMPELLLKLRRAGGLFAMEWPSLKETEVANADVSRPV